MSPSAESAILWFGWLFLSGAVVAASILAAQLLVLWIIDCLQSLWNNRK